MSIYRGDDETDRLEYLLMKLNKKNAEPLGPVPSIEQMDHISPILDAITYFNNLLIENDKTDHLEMETIHAINRSIAELSVSVVQIVSSPRMFIKIDN